MGIAPHAFSRGGGICCARRFILCCAEHNRCAFNAETLRAPPLICALPPSSSAHEVSTIMTKNRCCNFFLSQLASLSTLTSPEPPHSILPFLPSRPSVLQEPSNCLRHLVGVFCLSCHSLPRCLAAQRAARLPGGRPVSHASGKAADSLPSGVMACDLQLVPKRAVCRYGSAVFTHSVWGIFLDGSVCSWDAWRPTGHPSKQLGDSLWHCESCSSVPPCAEA